MPGGTIEPIEVPWQGQMYKFGSTHTFEDWTCTFNVDANADLKRQFDLWSAAIHDPATNQHGVPDEYFGEAKVELLDGKGNPVMANRLFEIWPSAVGQIDLSYDTKDVAQLEVTFSYNWHEHD